MVHIFFETILFMFGLGDNPINKHYYKSDADSFASDWITVGKDLKWALENYEE